MSFLSILKGNSSKKIQGEELPLLPLREIVLYPSTMVPVFITYKSGIIAVDEALRRDMRLFAACIRDLSNGEPYPVGTVVRIVQYLKLPDNTFRIVLQGEYRATIANLIKQNDLSIADITPISTILEGPLKPDMVALLRSVQKSFAQYAEFSKKISTDTLTAVEKTENPERIANLVSHTLAIPVEQKIDLLSVRDPVNRLSAVLETLERENEIFDIQKNIRVKVKSRIDKNQRDYILHEQLKEINKELGKDSAVDDFDDLERLIEERCLSTEALQKAHKELARLRKLQTLSPEAGVIRGYLEWIADLPWSVSSVDSGDLTLAEKVLNEDHFALQKAKERILEFIAVLKLLANTQQQTSVKGPILCFVGPPGTGKTSLGKSVARALKRQFVRISLGGLRDEAEIRGHRKTYVGALPGKIIQSMKHSGTINPVILLDEIDKLSSDFRGDPASALLEVLDPEQNINFIDHYLEIAYDLSKVLFITTANSLHTIPYPLLDRMEIIEIPGYSENEKLHIAQQFLIPKQLSENGLSHAKISFKDDAVRDIIRYWTMESGVRGLEREIARCIRRIARDVIKKEYGLHEDKPIEEFKKVVRKSDLEKLLGRQKYKNDLIFKEARVGVSYGLAWTEMGGTILPVETSVLEGSGELIVTGNIGDVMKESARIALSYIRSIQSQHDFYGAALNKTDIHLHVPEGAIPKDGPSAGITLASSIFSVLCRKAPKTSVAMTGELTLTGRILPIGGLKEKTLAAVRNGMKHILLPAGNREEWYDLDKEIQDSITAFFIENAEDAFTILFE
jgi:ATP-dependent Lon protease